MKRLSLRKKLILLFVLTSTIPIIVLSFYDLYHTRSTVNENTDFFVSENLNRVDDNLNVKLESYEDLLYQIYTNDDIVKWVDKLNAEEDAAVTINQMRRFLRGLFYTKDYVRAITIITESGEIISYDQLTPATYENSWIERYSVPKEELYRMVSEEKHTVILDTEYATTFANEDHYLFHLAHRVVDYRKPYRRNGIAIISIDERFLQEILQSDAGDEDDFELIIGKSGQVISCPDASLIGTRVTSMDLPEEERLSSYEKYITAYGQVKPYTKVYSYADEKLGWDIVEPIDQSQLVRTMNQKELYIIVLDILLLIIALFALRDVLRREKEANEEQRRAQVLALEAQINPHFLYNTLDTINWMAIDKEEFAISNAINSLATILRYAISKSDELVTVHDEMEWLKKYIYLQQYRLKNKFDCRVDVDPTVMELKIQKLLLQPFVENAILHGFARQQEQYILTVQISREGDCLKAVIEDNGCGMDAETLDRINRGEEITDGRRNHLGVKNALTRMHMYYDEKEKITVESRENEGTKITILIPV